MPRVSFAALFLASFVTATCTAVGMQADSAPIAPIKIPAPAGFYGTPIWLAPDLWVMSYEQRADDTASWTFEIWRMRPDGSDLRPIPFPKNEDRCRRTEFDGPFRLWDGRVAVVRHCFWRDGLSERVPDLQSQVHGLGDYVDKNWETHVLAWDPFTATTTQLLPYEIPPFGTLAFAPDLSRGVLGEGAHIEDKLYWLGPKGLSLVDLGMARSNTPTWSPDGEWIAFLGNRHLLGGPGPHWAGTSYDIWLMQADCDTQSGGCKRGVKRIIRNIQDIVGLSWSPDGQWLAFDGDPGGRGQGIWLRNVETGELVQATAGPSGDFATYASPEWSPDGTQLVFRGPFLDSGRQDLLDRRNALYVIDVSHIVARKSE